MGWRQINEACALLSTLSAAACVPFEPWRIKLEQDWKDKILSAYGPVPQTNFELHYRQAAQIADTELQICHGNPALAFNAMRNRMELDERRRNIIQENEDRYFQVFFLGERHVSQDPFLSFVQECKSLAYRVAVIIETYNQ